MTKARRAPALELETLIPILMKEWRRFHNLTGPEDRLQTREFRRAAAAVGELQKRSGVEGNHFTDRELLAGYLLYHWPLHYQEGISLINELPEPPMRVLDLCSGPSPYGFAALRHGAKELVACDQSLEALELGATVAGRYGLPMMIRQWKFPAPLPVEGQFDLIIVAHALRELFPEKTKGWKERQHAFLMGLFEKLNPGGHLLLVDSSWPEVNSRFLQMRDGLTEAGIAIHAPCIWQGRCPALQAKGAPCYGQRQYEKPHLLAELQRANDINLGSLKFSYLIAAKEAVARDPSLYRVISPPVEAYSGKRFYLCGEGGKKKLESHLAEQPKASRAFDFLERGSLISIKNPLVQGETFNIIEETEVTIAAAPGKAAP